MGIGSHWIGLSDVTFDTSAPPGHLPGLFVGVVVGGGGRFWCFLSRLSREDL